MSRVLPYPLLTASLLLMWLLLNVFLAGQFLLGGVVAVAASRVMAALQPSKPRLRRWQLIPRLAVIVALDILRSNIAVASIILQGGRHDRVVRLRRHTARAARQDGSGRARLHRHQHAGHGLDRVRSRYRHPSDPCPRPGRQGRMDRFDQEPLRSIADGDIRMSGDILSWSVMAAQIMLVAAMACYAYSSGSRAARAGPGALPRRHVCERHASGC